MLANQRELVSATRDIKNFVTDVHRLVVLLLQQTLSLVFFCSKVTALQSAQGRGTATVQQIGGGGDSVLLGDTHFNIFKGMLL